MYDADDIREGDFFDHDTAVMIALEKTEKGLFDNDETRDEDLEALYDN